jgi:hypothetical protein
MTTQRFFIPFLAGNVLPRRPLFRGKTISVIRLTNFLTFCAPDCAPAKTGTPPACNSAAPQVVQVQNMGNGLVQNIGNI